MYDFNYQAPATLEEALAAIAAAEDGKLLAGGMTLIPALKLRFAQPSDLIDLGRIAALRGIAVNGGTVTIGAMMTHAEVAASAEIQAAIPALASLAGHIGDPQVRHRGTIGGSICNNDPAADYPAALMALDATVETDRREIGAQDFFVGLFETALAPGEIATAVRFPIPERAAYRKFPNPASRYAVVGVFVAKTAAGIKVAVTGAGACVFRLPDFEQALARNFSPDAVASLKIPADELNADLHASAEYRAHLVTVMAKRAVASIA
jgi:carbon-monoxide dehydrogenase medium subunit